MKLEISKDPAQGGADPGEWRSKAGAGLARETDPAPRRQPPAVVGGIDEFRGVALRSYSFEHENYSSLEKCYQGMVEGLKVGRLRYGISATEAAERIGRSRRYLGRVENYEKKLGIDELGRLADLVFAPEEGDPLGALDDIRNFSRLASCRFPRELRARSRG